MWVSELNSSQMRNSKICKYVINCMDSLIANQFTPMSWCEFESIPQIVCKLTLLWLKKSYKTKAKLFLLFSSYLCFKEDV